MSNENALLHKLCISQYLEKHPILKGSKKLQSHYILVLQYFVEKYCLEDKFSVALLKLYKEKILLSQSENYHYDSRNIKSAFKQATAIKFNRFKLFSYRFSLVLDCLFICCFDDIKLSEKIFEEFLIYIKPKFHKKMRSLYEALYLEKSIDEPIEMIEYMYDCWQKNKAYFSSYHTNILITANMSAGKSTLINAIIGKTICQTKNDVCTSKLHYIPSKICEDGLNYEYDYELELNATHSVLMDNNELNETSMIAVGTYFRLYDVNRCRITLIDTPGVNSSQDLTHKSITEQAILSKKYDKLVYVINSEQIGTDDDRKHLEYVAEVCGDKQVIFVLNKLDKFRHGEDNVAQSIKSIISELDEIGFKHIVVCPVSAYAALLAKKKLYGEELSSYESRELEFLMLKFNEDEYELSKYSSKEVQEYGLQISESLQDEKHKKLLSLLNSCGILALEKIIFE